MNNRFTGVTPDKKMKTIEIDRYILQPDNPYVARVSGQLTYREVFDKLKGHLEYTDMLPDEYFNLSPEIDPDEHIPKDWHSFRLNTAFGGSEGIYTDITLDTDHESIDFATGKTLKDSTEDFLRMCRIAAECDLMLNGNGYVCELPQDVRDMLKNRSTTHGNVCDFNFYVTSFDTTDHYKNAEPMAVDLTLDESKSEFINRLNRYPDSVNTMLGIEFKTDRRDLNPHSIGAMDLIIYADGKMKLSEDWKKDPVLKEEENFPDLIEELSRYFSEGLSDSEAKLVRSGLVNGGKDVHEKSAAIKGEIEHHNDLEDEGEVDDDQWDM